MSLNGLADLFREHTHTPPMPRDYITGTGQSQEMEDVDMDRERQRDEIVRGNASVSVEQWIKQSLTVADDTKNQRFLVKIGRLVFPIGYDQLATETNIMVGIDPAVKGADTTQVFVVESFDKEKEQAKKNAAIIAAAKEELGKPLSVKRATLEQSYVPKT